MNQRRDHKQSSTRETRKNSRKLAKLVKHN